MTEQVDTKKSPIVGEAALAVARGVDEIYVAKGKKATANYRVASLSGPCHKGSAKRQLFASNTPSGTYKVQFDTKRKRDPKTEVKSVYTVTIFPMVKSGAARAASAGRRVVWTPAG